MRPSASQILEFSRRLLKPRDSSRPALRRLIEIELFLATLKRCFPLLKQRAPTTLEPEQEKLCFPPIGLRTFPGFRRAGESYAE